MNKLFKLAKNYLHIKKEKMPHTNIIISMFSSNDLTLMQIQLLQFGCLRSTKVYVLKSWSPWWHYWEMSSRRWGLVGGPQRAGGMPLQRNLRPRPLPLPLLHPGHKVTGLLYHCAPCIAIGTLTRGLKAMGPLNTDQNL